MKQHDTLAASVDTAKQNVTAGYFASSQVLFSTGVTKGCVIDIKKEIAVYAEEHDIKVDYNHLSLNSLVFQVADDKTQIFYSVGPLLGFSGALFNRDPDLVLCNKNLALKLNHLNVRTLKKLDTTDDVIFTEEDNTVSLELRATLDPEAKIIRVDHLSSKTNKPNVTVTIFSASFNVGAPLE